MEHILLSLTSTDSRSLLELSLRFTAGLSPRGAGVRVRFGVSVVSEFGDGSGYGGDYEDQGVGGGGADEDFAGEAESIV